MECIICKKSKYEIAKSRYTVLMYWSCCNEYICHDHYLGRISKCLKTFYIKHPYRNCKTKESLQNNI